MKRHGSQCLVGTVLLFENICCVLCQITTCERAACFLSSFATVCSVICTLHGPVSGLSGEHSQLVSMNFLSCNRRGKSVAVKESVVRLRASTVTQITFNSSVWNYCDTRFATPSNLNSPAIISWIRMFSTWKSVSSHLRHPQCLLALQEMITSWKTPVPSLQEEHRVAGEMLQVSGVKEGISFPST